MIEAANWLNDIQFWHWMAAGAVIASLEILVPGTVLMWMGISAIATGFFKLILPGLSWEIQFLIFAIFSVVSIAVSLTFLRKRSTPTDTPNLNRRGEQLIGRVVTLDTAIENGQGRIHIGDTMWTVRGENFMRGTRVKVTGVEGTILLIAKEG